MASRIQQHLQLLDNDEGRELLRNIQRGIEKESLRIDPQGHLAQTAHPAGLGSALTHDWITTDYSEALLEFITPVCTDIDRSLSVTVGENSIPGFSVSRAQTNVTVRHGQTIVLSGLFHVNEGKDLSKVPLLGHIPIIGELFKSRTFTEKKAELTVFVTPRIVNPDTPKILKMISDIKSRYKRAKGEVGFGIFD